MNIQHRDLITIKSLLRSAGSHVLRSAIPYCADQRVSYQRLVGSCSLLDKAYWSDECLRFLLSKFRGHFGDSPTGGFSGRGVGGETGCIVSWESGANWNLRAVREIRTLFCYFMRFLKRRERSCPHGPQYELLERTRSTLRRWMDVFWVLDQREVEHVTSWPFR